jgi:hypothetical protein
VAFATYRTGRPPARFPRKTVAKTPTERDALPLCVDVIINRRVAFVALHAFAWLGLAGVDQSQPRLKSALQQTNC